MILNRDMYLFFCVFLLMVMPSKMIVKANVGIQSMQYLLNWFRCAPFDFQNPQHVFTNTIVFVIVVC